MIGCAGRVLFVQRWFTVNTQLHTGRGATLGKAATKPYKLLQCFKYSNYGCTFNSLSISSCMKTVVDRL